MKVENEPSRLSLCALGGIGYWLREWGVPHCMYLVLGLTWNTRGELPHTKDKHNRKYINVRHALHRGSLSR